MAHRQALLLEITFPEGVATGHLRSLAPQLMPFRGP